MKKKCQGKATHRITHVLMKLRNRVPFFVLVLLHLVKRQVRYISLRRLEEMNK